MWTNTKCKFTLWYRKYFWKPEDHLAYIYGLKRKWRESDKVLRERIEDRLR